MKNLELIIAPNPILNRRTQKIAIFDDKLQAIIKQMQGVMLDHKGLGLSANQVGLNARMFIYATNPRQPNSALAIAANPKIISQSAESEIDKEGCLSVPNQEVSIARQTKITLLAQNESGERIKIKAKGLLARVFQHEIDHLNGKLITDYEI